MSRPVQLQRVQPRPDHPSPFPKNPVPGRPFLATVFATCCLFAADLSVAAAPLVLRGQLTFFNDGGAFLLDQGAGSGRSLGGKLAGVVLKAGAGDFVMKSIPAGAQVVLTVVKKGAYPEGTIRYAGRDLGEWLISKNLAVKAP